MGIVIGIEYSVIGHLNQALNVIAFEQALLSRSKLK